MSMHPSETEATVAHHLQAFFRLSIDGVLQDYAEDSVLIVAGGPLRGLKAIRGFFTTFIETMPAGFLDAFKMRRQEFVGEMGYIVCAPTLNHGVRTASHSPVARGHVQDRTMFDVIVVGARCAGSPAAMLLARKGYRVLLVDKATFPSDTMSTLLVFPIGMDCLVRWGLADPVRESGCPSLRSWTMAFGDLSLRGFPWSPHGITETLAPGERCSTRSCSGRPRSRGRSSDRASSSRT